MPQCPHCYFDDAIQAVVDAHVDTIHEDGGGVLIPSTVFDKTGTAWTCVASGLVITTNYHGVIINDQHTVVADADVQKFIQVLIGRNNPTFAVPDPAVSVYILERFEDGEFSELTAGVEKVSCLRTFSVVAGGTTLVVEE